jgi:hypothetical protein
MYRVTGKYVWHILNRSKVTNSCFFSPFHSRTSTSSGGKFKDRLKCSSSADWLHGKLIAALSGENRHALCRESTSQVQLEKQYLVISGHACGAQVGMGVNLEMNPVHAERASRLLFRIAQYMAVWSSILCDCDCRGSENSAAESAAAQKLTTGATEEGVKWGVVT